MRKTERAAHVLRRLGQLYPNPPIPLDHSDPFTLLVAVLLSAQCTDKMVNRVTPELFRVAGTPEAMRALGAEEILKIIRPLGLAPRKAIALEGLAGRLIDDFRGRVPDNFEDLESLPGVGHKTASVVMAQCFGHPAFPVDTHIHRLSQRWGLSSGKNVVETERDLKRLFPIESWNDLHLQIIYYGREHCTARSCDGTVCEICRELYPKRRRAIQHKKA